MYATLTAWVWNMFLTGSSRGPLVPMTWLGPAGYYPHRLDTTASNDT